MPSMRLRRLTLSRFKAFQHAELEIAPLTVLIGRNNQGKSSILQALAMLAQSAEATSAYEIQPRGTRIDLGTKMLDLTNHMEFPDGLGWSAALEWLMDWPKPQELLVQAPIEIRFEIQTHLKNESGSEFKSRATVLVPTPGRVVEVSAEYPPTQTRPASIDISANETQGLPPVKHSVGTSVLTPFWSQPSTNMGVVQNLDKARTGDIEAVIAYALGIAGPILREAIIRSLQAFRYVGPDRHVKESSYDLSNAAFPNPSSAAEVVNTIAYSRDILLRISDACRNVFGFGVDKDLYAGEKVGLVATDTQQRAINSVNLGAGFIQFIWILLQLELSVADSLRLAYPVPLAGVEEPELHLHPGLQPRVAELLNNFVMQDRQVITTSQSEHFLLALLQLVLEGSLPPEDLAVYYIDRGKAERLAVDDKGGLAGGLKGFFEADEKELLDRLKHLME